MKRKWLFTLAIAASVGLFGWMRELASWRPVLVARVKFSPEHLKISRDGRFLLAQNDERSFSAILDAKSGNADYNPQRIRDFDKNHGLETYPRVWMDGRHWRFVYSKAPGKNVNLAAFFVDSPQKTGPNPLSEEGVSVVVGETVMQRPNGEMRFGWSPRRHEVYGELSGEIWIWNGDNGKLKRRVRAAKFTPQDAVFSPDGKWLLAFEQTSKGNWLLRRYDVQTEGRGVDVDKFPIFGSFGFSPNGKYLYFTRANGQGTPLSFHIVPNADFKINWSLVRSLSCSGPSKWLPDGRIGIVEENGFEWRNASGRLIERLPGPFQRRIFKSQATRISDWVLSPDRKWIYSCERSGVIRRWRAR